MFLSAFLRIYLQFLNSYWRTLYLANYSLLCWLNSSLWTLASSTIFQLSHFWVNAIQLLYATFCRTSVTPANHVIFGHPLFFVHQETFIVFFKIKANLLVIHLITSRNCSDLSLSDLHRLSFLGHRLTLSGGRVHLLVLHIFISKGLEFS